MEHRTQMLFLRINDLLLTGHTDSSLPRSENHLLKLRAHLLSYDFKKKLKQNWKSLVWPVSVHLQMVNRMVTKFWKWQNSVSPMPPYELYFFCMSWSILPASCTEWLQKDSTSIRGLMNSDSIETGFWANQTLWSYPKSFKTYKDVPTSYIEP